MTLTTVAETYDDEVHVEDMELPPQTLDYAPAQARITPRRWLITSCLLVLLAATAITPMVKQANRGCVITNEMSCRSHLRIIGMAILLYANENSGHYPPDLPTVALAMEMSHSDLVCPATGMLVTHTPVTADQLAMLRQPGQVTYHYLGAGRTVSDVRPDEIIAWDDTCWSSGTDVNVLFGDGQTEMIMRHGGKTLLPLLRGATSPVRWPPVP